MMWTFSELLYTNDVLFSYYGLIDKHILNEALKIINLNLKLNNESMLVSKRLYNAINECVENVIKHNFFPDSASIDYKSLLLISKQKEHYLVDTINVVTVQQMDVIRGKLDFLTSKNKEELKIIKSDILSNKQYSEVSTAGLGMVDMMLKTDGCGYRFKGHGQDFLFNISFKINSSVNYANT